eukprot:2610390-Rhodomonas_salina.1
MCVGVKVTTIAVSRGGRQHTARNQMHFPAKHARLVPGLAQTPFLVDDAGEEVLGPPQTAEPEPLGHVTALPRSRHSTA